MPGVNIGYIEPLVPLTAAETVYDAQLAKSGHAIDIFATGTLFLKCGNGVTRSWPITAATPLPFRIYVGFDRIVGDGAGNVGDGTTGTDIALDDLLPLYV